MMQTDVLSGHIHQSGYIVQQYRSRIKAVSVRGSTSASELALFSTETAPVAATYAQTGANVVITTSSAHNLTTGQLVGISYQPGTGGAATSGNYLANVSNATVFTVISPNPNNVNAGAVCNFVINGNWLLTLDLAANDTYQNYFLFPGEGILCKQQCYALMSNVTTCTVFYG